MSAVEQEPAEVELGPASLAAALLRVQAAVAELDLRRDGSAEGGTSRARRYMTYPKLLAQVLPVLTANELVWRTKPTYAQAPDGTLKPALWYSLTFAPTGEADEGEMLLMLDKQTSQAQGSGLTYAKRQALQAALNIAPDGDDDGEAASQPPRPAPLDPEAPLSQAALDRMAEACDELDVDREELLVAVGVAPDATVTVGDGQKVSERLQRIRAQREAAE